MRGLILAASLILPVGGLAGGVAFANSQPAPAMLAAKPLIGSFEVTTRRAATDTPSTLADQEANDRYLGQTVTFGQTARWRDGIGCMVWDLSPKLQEPPLDASLEDLLADPPHAGWADLVCDEARLERLFFIDVDTFLSRTPNGVSWLVWKRVEEPQG